MDTQSIYSESGGWWNSFKFSKRATIFECFFGMLCIFARHFLKPKFKISPETLEFNTELSFGAIAKFADTVVKDSLSEVRATRIVDRYADINVLGPGIILKHTAEFERPKLNFIAYGEDPRLFNFKNEIYVYYQIPNLQISDTEIHIRKVSTNEDYKIESPFGFSGKNWIPFEYEEELYFVYGIDPLIILKANSLVSNVIQADIFLNNVPTNYQLAWNDSADRSFSDYRGGSSLVHVRDGIFLGFCHITPRGEHKDSHRLGIIGFEMSTGTIKLEQISKPRNRLLIDPYGIEIDGDMIFTICSVATGNPSRLTTVTGTIRAGWNVENLMEVLFKIE